MSTAGSLINRSGDDRARLNYDLLQNAALRASHWSLEFI